jgi:hypothetical protein
MTSKEYGTPDRVAKDLSISLGRKENKRYFNKRKVESKQEQYEGVVLPSSISQKSFNFQMDKSKGSLRLKKSLNLKTESVSDMSLPSNFRAYNKGSFPLKSRNPYDGSQATSIGDFRYSPLLRGLRSYQNSGAYMNSYIRAINFLDHSFHNNSGLSSFTNERNLIVSDELSKFREINTTTHQVGKSTFFQLESK